MILTERPRRGERANLSWTFLGTAAFGLSQWLVLAWLARLGSPADVGKYSYAVAITAPFFVFTDLQLRIHYVSETGARDRFPVYLRLRFLSGALGLVLSAVVGGFTQGLTLVWLGVLVMAVSRWIQSQSDMLLARPHAEGRLDLCGRSTFLKGVLGLVASVLFAFKFGYFGAILGWLVSRWAVYALVDRHFWGRTEEHRVVDWKEVATLLHQTLPLGLTMGLAALTASLPVFMLDHFASKAEIGLFAVVNIFGLIISLFANGISQNVAPKLAEAFKDGHRGLFDHTLFRFAMANLLMGGFVVVISLVWGGRLLSVLYGPAYGGYGSILALAMTASLVGSLASVMGCGMTGGRQYAAQVPILFAVLVVGGIALFLWVPTHGLKGAMFAMILANGFQFCLFWLGVRTHRGWAR